MNVGPTPGPQGRHRRATCGEGEGCEAGQGRRAGRFPTYLRAPAEEGGRRPRGASAGRKGRAGAGAGPGKPEYLPTRPGPDPSLERLPSSPSLLPSGEVGRGGARAHKPQKAPRPARPSSCWPAIPQSGLRTPGSEWERTHPELARPGVAQFF